MRAPHFSGDFMLNIPSWTSKNHGKSGQVWTQDMLHILCSYWRAHHSLLKGHQMTFFSWYSFDIHSKISSLKTRVVFIMPINLLEVSMKLEEVVLLIGSPGVKKGERKWSPHSQRAEALGVLLRSAWRASTVKAEVPQLKWVWNVSVLPILACHKWVQRGWYFFSSLIC